jgi:hypothetical protein
MERARAIHTIVVEMTTGMLVLAALATVILAFIAFTGRERHARLADAADAVVLFGAGIGIPMILLSILSGFRQWPIESFLHGAIVQNKIFASFMALSFWAGFLLLRFYFLGFYCLHWRSAGSETQRIRGDSPDFCRNPPDVLFADFCQCVAYCNGRSIAGDRVICVQEEIPDFVKRY